MNGSPGAAAWSDAVLAAALLAVDPAGLGGIVLTALAGPVRDRWLREFALLCPGADGRLPRFLPHMDDASLIGGLDLAATLTYGTPRVRRGLLAACDGGALVVPMAERLSGLQAAAIGAAMDDGEVNLQREGFSRRWPARLGVVLLNESAEPDDACPDSLQERCAFRFDLAGISIRDLSTSPYGADAIARARRRLPGVATADAWYQALSDAAQRSGIGSLRAPLLALRAARAAAALVGVSEVGQAQAKLAVRLVLGPRAVPDPVGQPEQPPAPEAASDAAGGSPTDPPPAADGAQPDDRRDEADDDIRSPDELTEMLVEAVFGAAQLSLCAPRPCAGLPRRHGPAGRTGPVRSSTLRGRPHGSRRGIPGDGARLDLLATLRAAAPWQRLRHADAHGRARAGVIDIRRDDLHLRRFRQRAATLTIFVVDASGSAALQRLGEAKGAVELLLADCYVRRDSVALVAFRGTGADLLLPPTRSLVRAKRSLAHLVGGGATPLTAGLDAATDLALGSQRRGIVPSLVLLTDGRGNVTRAGVADRRTAAQESLGAADRLRALELAAMLVDVSPRGQTFARELAARAGAAYLPLPHADAHRLSSTVRDLTAGSAGHAA